METSSGVRRFRMMVACGDRVVREGLLGEVSLDQSELKSKVIDPWMACGGWGWA